MKKNEDYGEIIQWSREYLLSHGYRLLSDFPENIQNTPWSYVARLMTSKGFIYLKHTPHLLALEANILDMLRHQFHAPVPEVIAHNDRLDCFLMKDAGRSIRTLLKQQFNAELFCKAIDQFTMMQLSVADDIDYFINRGVPDWRLNQLPDLFADFLAQNELLIKDGLSENEIRELESRIPMVADLCHKLSNFSIKESIVQPDFNDNNSLIDDSQTITIIDLGEITISHPFFSLLNGLQQMEKHHAVTVDSHDYVKMKEACLKNYMKFESRDNLLKAFDLARPLWFVYGALAGKRLIEACGQSNIMSYQPGKLVHSLREFIAA